MRSLMDDGQIHSDVITTLWQVYSQSSYLYLMLLLMILSRLREALAKGTAQRGHNHSRDAGIGREKCCYRPRRYTAESRVRSLGQGDIDLRNSTVIGFLTCSSEFQTDFTLARYTCVALQRLNGSAKKIKGTCR